MGINEAEMKKYRAEVEKEAKNFYWDVYGKVVEYKNFMGDPMPEWEKLPEKIQEAWIAVARNKIAAVHEYTKKLEASQEKINDLEMEIASLGIDLEIGSLSMEDKELD